MWYTILVLLDVFLWWFITTEIITFFKYITTDLICLIPEESYSLCYEYLSNYLPTTLVNLIFLFPNVLLFGFYMSFLTPKESKWFKSLRIWDLKRKYYFKVKVEHPPGFDEEKIAKDKQVLYAVFPHGVYGASAIFYFILNKTYLKCVAIGTSLLFYIPIVREFVALVGARPANSGDMIDVLDQGKSIVMLPGGLRELLHINEGKQGSLDVYEGKTKEGNKSRKGFIRYTKDSKNIKHISIVPVYVEGGDKLYDVWLPFPWLQNKLLRRWYYPWPVIAIGLWFLPFWPKPKQLTYKFGKPIENLKDREVDDIFKEFISQMKELMEMK